MAHNDKVKILLLEGIHERAVENFCRAGFARIEREKKALSPGELIERIKDVNILGIRSKTRVTREILARAGRLEAIGAFCIGTNQIDLRAAKLMGVPVFNSPLSNTRSVAELVIAEIIMLMRGIPEKNIAAHEGRWLKSADNSREIRGKHLGIIGYGHIGSQVSILAEGLGMTVSYFDTENKLSLGNADARDSLSAVLGESDVITLHVPATAETENLIGGKELARMKPGSFLINASRGNVVVIPDLARALDDGHLAGAAIDVFPAEPGDKNEEFVSELRGRPNVLLTPHIGGSTLEAQESIGQDGSDKLARYLSQGTTLGAVNFVNIALPATDEKTRRFIHIHRNVPGVLARLNQVFSSRSLNILGQYLSTDQDIGYVITDIENNIDNSREILSGLKEVPNTIKARLL